MLLKSSDFISHDIDVESVFEGCDDKPSAFPPKSEEPSKEWPPPYVLELVLRKWYPVNPSRELRCFVKDNKLIGEPGIEGPCTRERGGSNYFLCPF